MANATLNKELKIEKRNNFYIGSFYLMFFSDGTDESKVTKIDISGLKGIPEQVYLLSIKYHAYRIGFQVYTKHPTVPAQDKMFFCGGDGSDIFDLTPYEKDGFGGYLANGGDGGDILISTVNAALGSSYSIKIKLMWKV